MMKKIITIVIVILLFQFSIENCFSQSPNGISYQGVARNSTGAVISSKAISIRFSLHDSTADGTVVYCESHAVNTNINGLFTLNIGKGNPVTGTFDTVDWGSGAKFLQVEMDAAGGTTFVDMGTTQMMSVPYALYAKTAGSSVGSVTYAGTWDASSNNPPLENGRGIKGAYYVVTNSGSTLIDGNSDWKVNDWIIHNGTKWEKVDNTDDQVNNKADKIVPATSGNFAGLNTSGNLTDSGLNSSDLVPKGNTIPYTPSTDYNPATKKYVDDSMIPLQQEFADVIDSFISRKDDGITVYNLTGTTIKRFGIGDTTPSAPLGIKAEGSEQKALVISPNTLSTGSSYSFQLTSSGNNGFDISENAGTVSKSRLFIQESTGNIGMGTNLPNEKLHIQSNAIGGFVGESIQNTAVSKNNGWAIGHLNDEVIAERNGTFSINEIPISGTNSLERITILPSGNVGINEKIPDTNLHVTRGVSDPNTSISLSKKSGIATFGTESKNIVLDFQGIQARNNNFSGTLPVLETSTLNLQRLGGDVIFHGDSSIPENEKVIISSNGKMGVGILTPMEKLEINGRLVIGDSGVMTPSDGTIRYTGTDFEGRKGSSWVSLTNDSAWKSGGSSNKIYYNATDAKVGIGTDTPTSSLHVANTESTTSSSTTSLIQSQASTSSSSSSNTRVGLEIQTSGAWSSNADAKNVGLYVSSVTGQAKKEANIAAVLNGNVVIGGVNSSKIVGTNGANVLAIQNGTAPTVAPGSTTNGGVQIYSVDSSSDGTTPPVSEFHVMNGDGNVLKLSAQNAITPANTNIPNSGDTSTDAIINNLRTRVNELEAVLKNMGIIKP